MRSALEILRGLPNAKPCPVEKSLMEQHEWHQDSLQCRKINRTNWNEQLDQLSREKA